MPTFDQFSEFISQVGFPIFICLVLLYFMRELLNDQKTMLQELKNSIETNTRAIQRIIDRN